MLDVLIEIYNNILTFLYSLMLTLKDLLIDVGCYVFDGSLNVVLFAVDALSHLFSSLNVLQYLSMIPPEVQNVMALSGVNEASSMIVTACIARLLLQLIPFTRLGS